MDRIGAASHIITKLNAYRNGELEDYQLIEEVCGYFDKIKDQQLLDADFCFLKYISNVSGIPHFYDLLEKYGKDISINSFDLNTLSALIFESTLTLNEDTKVHKFQKQILQKFKSDQLNRYFLSASTSFGKTHIVYEIIKRMDYDNVVLIFPTIALLSENLERLTSSNGFEFFTKNYSVHTLSDVESIGSKNLFIYTPERFLSFVEKNENQVNFNFAFIDEIYKIDSDYIIDERFRENERDIAYRLAVFYSLNSNCDSLLAGPYIEFCSSNDSNYNPSFELFLKKNKIEIIDYNKYEIVNKTVIEIKSKKKYQIDSNLTLSFKTKGKGPRLLEILKQIFDINENAIIYCQSKSSVGIYAKKIISSEILNGHSHDEYIKFIEHISGKFHKDWTLIKALKKGVGIHHGLIPKYIQKEVISLFNKGLLKVLLSTTTITEGVNTSAKNLIVLKGKKGNKNLKKFDAKNIAGRAGRFMQHYTGRVIVLDKEFMDAIGSEQEGIKHKNYDEDSPKEEVDLFYTKDEYLKEKDRDKKNEIISMQRDRGIPNEIFQFYKTVSRSDKIEIYDAINSLDSSQIESIKSMIQGINFKENMKVDQDGFQVVLNILKSIVKNEKLKFLINTLDQSSKYSLLTHLINYYFKDGFIGGVKYKMNGDKKSADEAISQTSEFVYNTLRYHAVKYLGVFNLMYKFYISKQKKISIEEVSGLDKLLVKLEYNAVSEKGKVASDFGVPSSIIEFYENEENPDEANVLKNNFDEYERAMFQKVEKVIDLESGNDS